MSELSADPTTTWIRNAVGQRVPLCDRHLADYQESGAVRTVGGRSNHVCAACDALESRREQPSRLPIGAEGDYYNDD